MYMRVTSPTKDSTIRVQLNFQANSSMHEHHQQQQQQQQLEPECFTTRVQLALTSSYVLLCQPGPNSFVLVPKDAGSTSPGMHTDAITSRRARYHVIIGPQLCTCLPTTNKMEATTSPCVHVLFVMLRVLHTPLDDPCLRQIPLPTSKAESLIHAFLKYKNSISQNNRILPQTPKRASPTPLTGDSNNTNNTQSPVRTELSNRSGANMTPLAMPKPIYPCPSNVTQTPNLLAIVNASVQNAPECHELSTLTKGIRPSVWRHETESAGAVVEVSTTSSMTMTSRTSSIDSSEGGRAKAIQLPRYTDMEGMRPSDPLVVRRPRTAPQPEPPPRLGRGRVRSIRHALSTTFRPIKDCSPAHVEGKLSPIKSGDASAPNTIRLQLADASQAYESLQQPYGVGRSKLPHDANDLIGLGEAFSHVQYSPFKPITHSQQESPNPSPLSTHVTTKTTTTNSFRPGLVEAAKTRTPLLSPLSKKTEAATISPCRANCPLCLLPLECSSSTSDTLLFHCRPADPGQCCLAAFHLNCCQIWLEEMSADGDTPYCPVCFSRWDITGTMLKEPNQSNRVTLPHLSASSCCCSSLPPTTQQPPSLPPQLSSSFPSSMTAIPQSGSPELIDGVTTTLTNLPSDLGSQPLVGVEVQQAQTVGPSEASFQSREVAEHGSSGIVKTPYPEYKSCISAFSLEIADGIASRLSAVRRQVALQHAAQLTVRRILFARQQSSLQLPLDPASDSTIVGGAPGTTNRMPLTSSSHEITVEPDCLRIMFRLIQYLFDDPVDAVYIDALRAFREMLGYLVCFNIDTQIALQRAIGPILRRLLRFVGGPSVLWSLRDPLPVNGPTPQLMHQTSQSSVDSYVSGVPNKPEFVCTMDEHGHTTGVEVSNSAPGPAANLRDRANLALATLVELAKGQHGALAIGRDVGCASQCLPICGLQHMTRFVLSSAKFHATHLTGRLTLLDKLIRMDQSRTTEINNTNADVAGSTIAYPETVGTSGKPVDMQSSTSWSSDRLARRHLCSSLVFARRHLLPPSLNPGIIIPDAGVNGGDICESVLARQKSSINPSEDSVRQQSEQARIDGQIGGTTARMNSLYNTQLKASRVARRVFLTAARSLLTYDQRVQPNLNPSGKRTNVYVPHEFCPREFVELEINRTELPVTNWLRNKLAPMLHPNLVLGLDNPLIPIRMTVSEAPNLPAPIPPSGITDCEKIRPLPTSQTLDRIPCTDVSSSRGMDASGFQTTGVYTTATNTDRISWPTGLSEQPPAPPPRRHIRFTPNSDHFQLTTIEDSLPSIRVALEPAYDPVALSETGKYHTASEAEDEEAEQDQKLDRSDDFENTIYSNEPTYGGRSLGSEAELQSEQAAVLRSALRQGSRRCVRPLLPVPALSMVMEAFRTTKQLPSADEYYESIDWVRGPLLGHGAFSQCFQARDTRTGLLMAVKRIRLGGGSVCAVVADKANAVKLHRTEKIGVSKSHQTDDEKSHQKEGDDSVAPNTADHLSTAAASQLVEVQAEVRIMVQLSHPNILRLYGAVFCSQRGLVDVFVEWMPGGSVTNLLHQYGSFNVSVTLAYGVQVVRGLVYLHKHGILHRDLKGANLLVDTTGSVIRISDFGASARLIGEKSVAGQFQGQVIGTFAFMAPEVLRGETYGRACDIWSVGCCLIEMLTSKPPWYDARLTNRYAVMFAIATSHSPPPYPPNLDEYLTTLLDACFDRQATKRPTASELLHHRAFSRLIDPHHELSNSDGTCEQQNSHAIEAIKPAPLTRTSSLASDWSHRSSHREARRFVAHPSFNHSRGRSTSQGPGAVPQTLASSQNSTALVV